MRLGLIFAGLLLASLTIALSSIALRLYGKCAGDDKEARKGDRNFVIMMLVAGIALGGGMLFFGFKKTKKLQTRSGFKGSITNNPLKVQAVRK